MVGEAWSVIMGGGAAFSDQTNPTVMVRVGEPGSEGIVEITDILFATQGPGTVQNFKMEPSFDSFIWIIAPGAIVVEWNIHSDQQGGAGMWDSHIRYDASIHCSSPVNDVLRSLDWVEVRGLFLSTCSRRLIILCCSCWH